jgi:hypothetical protein
METTDKYAKGIVSLQMTVEHEGVPCFVLVRDPKLNKGYMFPGGYFFPAWNISDAAEEIQGFVTGAKLYSRPSLRKILYSRTQTHGHWIANHAFSARAKPVEEWEEPTDREFEVSLFDIRSFHATPRKVATVFPRDSDKDDEFRWTINDGPYLTRMAVAEYYSNSQGKRGLEQIPTVTVPIKNKGILPNTQGYGINIGNVVLTHTYKGEDGYVYIINSDSLHPALIGGKVENLRDVHSNNVDVHSCIVSESGGEIGVNLHALSVIGTALTPIGVLDSDVRPREIDRNDKIVHSLITTSVLARAANPAQLTDAIDHPEKYISERDKIRGIYFMNRAEFATVIASGEMRTPDMIPLALQAFNGSQAERPNLESIALLPFDKISDYNDSAKTLPHEVRIHTKS